MILNEFSIIDLLSDLTSDHPCLIKGIGDDTAVIKANEDFNYLVSVDSFTEKVHFNKRTMSPYDLGYKVLAANVSDMIAMGGEAQFYLLSLGLPETINEDFILAFKEGLNQFSKEAQIILIGGDTVTSDHLSISVTMIGRVKKDLIRYRHLAKEGDYVFVTGSLGKSAYGLDQLLNQDKQSSLFIKEHQQPMIRLQFPKASNAFKRIALNDISDGIANELNEIAEASSVSITIKEELLPIHTKIKALSADKKEQFTLYGGEDFELVGTIDPTDFDELVARCEQVNIPVTKIGRVSYNEKGKSNVYLVKNGKKVKLNKDGYTHLK